MCFAYFKMNKFEKNPKKYINSKCEFLFLRGYSLKTFTRNAECCFDFYIKGNNTNHIYFLCENEFIDCTFSNNIDLIDARPISKLQQALNLSKEKKHVEAYSIYEVLYNEERRATNAFNLFQCAVYCGKKEVEEELYRKLKSYSPNLKKNQWN